jgi:hypothetical protein
MFMKRLITLLSLSAIALALPVSSIAAEKEKAAAGAKKATEKAVSDTKAAAEKAVADVTGAKPIPMHVRADAIDAKAGTFTMTRKDGVQVKHVVTDKTDIKNGEAAAKLADIKPGEFVNGLRVKKSETEYEVVKITKFGPAPDKEAPPAVGEAPKEKKEKK